MTCCAVSVVVVPVQHSLALCSGPAKLKRGRCAIHQPHALRTSSAQGVCGQLSLVALGDAGGVAVAHLVYMRRLHGTPLLKI